uniref:G-protein coupled receptors family 1 profile domain-containing protein n=1 Tax=Romanomermis culicivorax TaxID=13658 RepID=A0A915JHM2_ROMCU
MFRCSPSVHRTTKRIVPSFSLLVTVRLFSHVELHAIPAFTIVKMNNFTNNDTIPTLTCQLRHHVVAALYSIFFSWNVFFATLVLVAIVKLGRSKVEFRNTYHQLLANLLAADAAYFGVYLVGSLPNILSLTCQKVFSEMGLMLLGLGNVVITVSLITNILFIAVNRCKEIVNGNIGSITSSKKILAMKMLIWVSGPLFALINFLVGGCLSRFLSRFNAANPSFGVRCTSISPLITPHAVYNYSCIYGSLFLYLICIKKLRARSNQVQTEDIAEKMYKRQMQILLQATSICLSFTFSLTMFRLLPYITDEIFLDLVHITVGLNGPYSVPLIAVIFSSALRSSLRSYLPSAKIQIFTSNAASGSTTAKNQLSVKKLFPESQEKSVDLLRTFLIRPLER